MKVQVCRPFKYNIDEGAKVFSIAEFFLSIVNFVNFIFLVILIHRHDVVVETEADFSWFIFTFFKLLLAITLLTQVILGLFLYCLGWAKRNITICWAWVIVAVANATLVFMIWIVGIILIGTQEDAVADHHFAKYNYAEPFCCWHMFYTLYGAIIMINFIRWTKAQTKASGIATQSSLTLSNKSNPGSHHHHQSQSTHSQLQSKMHASFKV